MPILNSGKTRKSNNSERPVISEFGDGFCICAPLWIPFVIYLLITWFPQNQATIFIGAYLFLAETHFAATWLFFFDHKNQEWIKKKPVIFMIIPFFLLASVLFTSWYISISAALMIGAVLSTVHVTRQSIGIVKMFSQKNPETLRPAFAAIYSMSAIFILIGFARFYTRDLANLVNADIIQRMAFAMVFIVMFYLYYKCKDEGESWKFYMATFTGMILYSPFCLSIIESAELASTMGVGMHWMQYLALTMSLYLRKSEQSEPRIGLEKIYRNLWALSTYLILYAIVMVGFRLGGSIAFTFEYSKFILIPLCFQVLHYYFDAFIWRFSDPHIRKEVGQFVFRPTRPFSQTNL